MIVIGVFHGDPIVAAANLQCLAGFTFEDGDYVITGVLRGSIAINTGSNGAGPARLILQWSTPAFRQLRLPV